jgi:hypothetical protein
VTFYATSPFKSNQHTYNLLTFFIRKLKTENGIGGLPITRRLPQLPSPEVSRAPAPAATLAKPGALVYIP